MSLKIIPLIFSLLLCYSLTYSQEVTKDSVRGKVINLGHGLLERENLDTLLMKAREVKYLADQVEEPIPSLYAFIYQYTGTIFQRMSKLDSAILYTEKSINQLKTLDNHVLRGDAFNLQGLNYWDIGDYMSAIAYFDTSMIAYQMSEKSYKITQPSNNLGLLYKELGDYDKSLEFYQKALDIHEANERLAKILSVKGNMSMVFMHMHEFDKAEAMAKNCIAKGQENMSDTVIYIPLIRAFGQLGRIYENKGVTFSDTSYFEKSLIQHEKALKNWRLLGGRAAAEDTVTTLLNIGSIHQYLENYEVALAYYQKCLPLAEQDNQLPHHLAADIFLNISNVYFSLGDREKGLEYLAKFIKQKHKKEERQKVTSTILQPTSLDYWRNALQAEKRLGEERQRNTEVRINFWIALSVLATLASLLGTLTFYFKEKEKLATRKSKVTERELQAQDRAIEQLRIEEELIKKESQLKERELEAKKKEINQLKLQQNLLKKENQLKDQELKAQEEQINYLEKIKDNLRWIQKAKDLKDILYKYGQDIHTTANVIAVALGRVDLVEKELLEILSKEKYDKIYDIIKYAYNEVRNMSHTLLDLEIDSDPNRALSSHCKEICEQHENDNLRIEWRPYNLGQMNLPMEVKRHLISILKEALGNIIKHSEAAFATVEMTYTEGKERGELSVVITDYGKGFNINETKNGKGLSIIRQFIEDLGGIATILSKPEKFTSISFNIDILR